MGVSLSAAGEVGLRNILQDLGIDPEDESAREQAMVMFEALSVFGARNKKYKDLWKEYGAEDNLLHMRSKLDRTRRTFEDEVEDPDFDPENLDLDDAIDLVNYDVFFIRNVRAGRVG